MALTRRTEAQSAKRASIEAAVLAATEALLGEGSAFADLGIEQIARRAGISRTAFYFYFSDKRELLMRLTEDAAEALYAEADRWWSTGEPGEVREALTQIVSLYAEHRALLRAVVEAATYDDEVAGFWRALVGRFVEATRVRIEAEQAAGRTPTDRPAEVVAFALCWMTERVCYQYAAQGEPFSPGELIDALTAVWLGAVA